MIKYRNIQVEWKENGTHKDEMTNMDNRLGMYSWFGYMLPLQERLRLIKQASFDSTMVWWGDSVAFYEHSPETIPPMVRDAGLYLENIHAPYEHCNRLWSETAWIREETAKQYITWVKDCEKYTIPMMVMHVTDGPYEGVPTAEGIDTVKQIAAAAHSAGIQLAVENTRNPEFITRLLEEIPEDTFGFCFDFSHDWLCSKHRLALLKEHGSRLFTVHMADNDGVDDRHWLPGEGVMDWELMCNALPPAYTGCLSLEVVPHPYETDEAPEAFMNKAYQCAVRLRKEIQSRRNKHVTL